MGAGVYHADRETNRSDEANTRFSQFCQRTLKYSSVLSIFENLSFLQTRLLQYRCKSQLGNSDCNHFLLHAIGINERQALSIVGECIHPLCMYSLRKQDRKRETEKREYWEAHNIYKSQNVIGYGDRTWSTPIAGLCKTAALNYREKTHMQMIRSVQNEGVLETFHMLFNC